MFRSISIIFIICLCAFCVRADNLHDAKPCPQGAYSDAAQVAPTEDKILNLLDKQAPKGMFPKNTKIMFLGTVRGKHASYNVIFTSLVWGQAQRETARLVIFSLNWKYLGNYGEIYTPPSLIQHGVLYWPYPAELGNKISLMGHSPPKKVVLNGEVYLFDTERQ